MKLDAGEIKDLVNETERKRSNWASWADEWESMWRLCQYEDGPKDHKELDGVRSVTMPDPFNVIQLLQRFVAHEMRVEIPSISTKQDDEDRSEIMEAWTLAFDILSNRQQGTNHSNDMVWQSGVLGRGAAQVLWIGDVIPKGISTDRVLPIWRRILDPRNVGVARGAYWTDYAYHKYKTTRNEIEQRYPKFKLPDVTGRLIQGYYNEKYEITDFWCLHQGAIWHSVVINGEFALGPVKTDYPDIPIIEWYADGAPVADDMGRSLSILHPMRDVYRLKNDFVSTMATGLEYHYNPLVIAKNLGDQRITVGPGATIYLNENQSIEAFRAEPNVPMAQSLLGILQQGIDQATFPGVTYGENNTGLQAGFAINNLAQQAKSRANTIRNNIEAAMEAENQIIYALIEAFAAEKGIEIYNRKTKGERGKPLKLNKKVIKGNYANAVKLIPEMPMDDTQKILAWSGLAEKGLISKAFFRDEALNVQMPRDEETKIAVERALESPEMQLKVQLAALQDYYPQEVWELRIQGTPLQPVWEQEKAWLEQKKAQEEAAKEARRLEKQQREMQERLMNMPPLPPELMMPPGMMPPSGMSGGMPPGPSSMPSMPGGMPGMPPTLPSSSGLTMNAPGGNIPMTPGGGMPPEMMGMGMPMGNMQPEGLPGVPPQMAAQISPDQLGIPPGAPPGTFDQLMGGPPPTDEELLRGMMGGGMPPQF